MADSLTGRVLETIRSRALLRGGETVLVAVSGGADSVALLHVLCELRADLPLTLGVGHVHHGLRAGADADAELVGALCRRLELPLQLERVRVERAAGAGARWQGLEAEARRVRYAALARMAGALGAGRVATAHTADDQAETVLMRLLQGAGPRGLAGIPPARGALIRPLIDTRRADVEAYLRSRGIAWVEDETNREPRFLRTRIRRDLLPYLIAQFEPRLVPLLGRSADLTRGLVADLELRAAEALEGLAVPTPAGIALPVGRVGALPAALAAEVLRAAALRAGAPGSLRAPSHRAIARALDPAATASRARLGALVLERSGPWLRVGPRALPALGAHVLAVPAGLHLEVIGARLAARVRTRPADYAPPRGRTAVAFDADRMPAALVVRGRRSGDRFWPFGGSGERRLKAFLVDAGVPRWERERVPLLEAQGDIAWVVGLRRSAVAPVTPETRRILEVTVDGCVAPLARPE